MRLRQDQRLSEDQRQCQLGFIMLPLRECIPGLSLQFRNKVLGLTGYQVFLAELAAEISSYHR
jgi:hypothetical protein